MLAAMALRRSLLAAVCAVLVGYSMLLHAVFVAKPRYNLPLMAILMVGGVVAAVALLTARRERRNPASEGGFEVQCSPSPAQQPSPSPSA